MNPALKPAAAWPFPSGAVVAAADQNFVTVPETTLPAYFEDGVEVRAAIVEPAFQVAKYFAAKGADGKLVISRDLKPLTGISHYDSLDLCAASGFGMITETQSLALALHLSQVAGNWISGTVGEGDMYQGLHLDHDDVDEPYDGNFVSADPLERREFYLADGSVVLDAAGNLYAHVFDNVQGNDRGVTNRPFAAGSPSITTAPFPSMQKGMGYYPRAGVDYSGFALMRGGCWYSGDHAGVFYLGYVWPDNDYDRVGVRCTKPIGL